MARRNVIGFASGSLNEVEPGTGTRSVQSAVKRSGSHAYMSNPVAGAVGYDQVRGYTSTGARGNLNTANIYAAFPFRCDLLPASGDEEFAVAYGSIADKATFRLTSAGKIRAYNAVTTQVGESSMSLQPGLWYWIEIGVGSNASSGLCAVRVNGNTVISTMTNTSGTNCNQFRIGKVTNRNSNSVVYYYDQVILDDATWVGQSELVSMLPSGNGSATAWTGDYTLAAEVPWSDADYLVSTGITDDAELFALPDIGSQVRGPILSVATHARVVRDGGTNGTIALRRRVDGVNYDLSSLSVGSAMVGIGKVDELAPSGSAWAIPNLKDLEVGAVELGANATRLAAMLAYVEYRTPTVSMEDLGGLGLGLE